MNFYLLLSLIICGLIHAGVPRGVGVALQRRFLLVDGLWCLKVTLESDEP